MLRLLLALALLLAACGTEPAEQTTPAETAAETAAETSAEPAGTLRLYTSVTQDTVDAVAAAYRERQPDVTLEVFRAPTGELDARIAAEQREGGVRADVLWLTDPLSMQQYDQEGLLAPLDLPEASVVPAQYRTETFVGTRILNMIIVHQAGVEPAPASWSDLTDPAYRDGVAIPDPGFAGSAFGALGYFALADGFGMDYYRALAENGAVQVQAPGEVISGVAEGRFVAGMTLANPARTAADKGSPIELVVPEPGAIAIYSPIAVLDPAENADAAESFADFVLTREAQEAIAATGWEPIRDDVDWPYEYAQVAPDWAAIADRQDELLEDYRAVFGG